MQGLAFHVFPVEWGSLNMITYTFLSVPGSSTTLNTLDLICARMLERQPLASSVWMTKFFSSLSYYIFENIEYSNQL